MNILEFKLRGFGYSSTGSAVILLSFLYSYNKGNLTVIFTQYTHKTYGVLGSYLGEGGGESLVARTDRGWESIVEFSERVVGSGAL